MKEAKTWLEERESVRDFALFLDFDGTLAPIVERPGDARPLEGIRELVDEIGKSLPVAIISGRGLDDVKERLGADNIYVAGSHGMEIVSPGGKRHEPEEVVALLPALERYERELRRRFEGEEGIEIERKRFGIAVHFRRAPQKQSAVEEALGEVVDAGQGLKMGTGKMVRELQPDVDWHKGTALTFIANEIDPDKERLPIYIGDDTTDEDAFEAVEERGVGILVSEERRPSAATLLLQDPEDVRDFLRRLAAKARGA